jgi:excisionase family DNA binding protein
VTQACSSLAGRRPGTAANPQGGLLSLALLAFIHSRFNPFRSIRIFEIGVLMEGSAIGVSHSVFESVPLDAILLDAGEVAQILRVPRSWVYGHLSELPVIRLGRYVRFRRSEIECFLEKRAGACQ